MSPTPNPKSSTRFAQILAGLKQGLIVGLVIAVPFGVYNFYRNNQPVPSTTPAAKQAEAPRIVRQADFGSHAAAPDVRRLANWVADSRDSGGAAFVIVDKKNTHVYVFSPEATLQGESPVLLGGARGDDSVDGIGLRAISAVRPEERTTPAGRFVGERGHNTDGEDVVWVDYDAAVSMHRVRTANKAEKRLERLATPTTEDNRISYGCINVPVAFYEQYVKPAFAQRKAVIYVLPEQKALNQVFAVDGEAKKAQT